MVVLILRPVHAVNKRLGLVHSTGLRNLLVRFCGSPLKMNINFMMSEELELRTLKLLEHNPHLTQRELAAELGISLGKTHYVIKALVDIGWIKLANFRRSDNKLGYAYLMTPQGLLEKAAITKRFLLRKQNEYRQLRGEIELLQLEVGEEMASTSVMSETVSRLN